METRIACKSTGLGLRCRPRTQEIPIVRSPQGEARSNILLPAVPVSGARRQCAWQGPWEGARGASRLCWNSASCAGPPKASVPMSPGVAAQPAQAHPGSCAAGRPAGGWPCDHPRRQYGPGGLQRWPLRAPHGRRCPGAARGGGRSGRRTVDAVLARRAARGAGHGDGPARLEQDRLELAVLAGELVLGRGGAPGRGAAERVGLGVVD
jgi:hypothetical protein